MGINVEYIEQPAPDGIAQAYLLAENFLDGCPSTLILGDNFFYGGSFVDLLKIANKKVKKVHRYLGMKSLILIGMVL